MSEFRFRAVVALDLRRKQETNAATALAVAEAEFRAAEARATEADAQKRTAQGQQLAAARRGTDVGTLLWHRNWITRLSHDLAERRRQVDRLSQVVRDAEGRWRKARQKRLALERMRDRAWRRFQLEQQRQEMKVIDELARLRHVLPDTWRDDA